MRDFLRHSRLPTLAAASAVAAGFARKVTLVSVGALLTLGMIPAVAAHADGKITWQNNGTQRYLEVYHSSTSAGAYVGTWPWNGTATQYWYDEKLSDGYWAELNYNSALLLTTYNNCSDGITQWPPNTGNTAYATQEWHENYLDSSEGWVLINKAGCSGDPYHDVLSQSLDQPSTYNVWLYSEKAGGCDLSYWPDAGPENLCTWK